MPVRLLLGRTERVFKTYEILGGKIHEEYGDIRIENGHIKADGVEFFGSFRVKKRGSDTLIEKV